MKTIRFAIIGCGLMGKEFASAAARWCHLPDMRVRQVVVAVCDTNECMFTWFRDNFSHIKQYTTDYREILSNETVDAVYCPVPHNLHERLYCDTISAGKHLMGEKPFGIDRPANEAILEVMKANPDVFVRCSSEFPFIPAVQRLCGMIEREEFGDLIEVNSGFMHSSDLDTTKPINWKRMIASNGEYGCLGDLGMHACHVPFRAGWSPKNVRAILSDLVPERPDGKGGIVPCETWDNATLFCETVNPVDGKTFPWTMKTQRIAPGEKDTWYLEVIGMKKCARYSSKNTNAIEILDYTLSREQAWQRIDMGHETAFKSITGGIFEFGFSDSILQMWAAFLYELVEGKPLKKFAGCVTPDETALSHRLFTAALQSQREKTTVPVE
ncbi:MAG: Gfo/Idh/MocA family oxidoreductase [Armatimonadetes bacterium]|nr:Gfo/Idh/MocA family oxidoreductase [Armatimonadota bacterium]